MQNVRAREGVCLAACIVGGEEVEEGKRRGGNACQTKSALAVSRLASTLVRPGAQLSSFSAASLSQ